MRRAVFLDRDGVLVEDVDRLVRAEQIALLPGVPAALDRLAAAGFALVPVTNQPVVARGLVSLDEVEALNDEIARRIVAAGGPALERAYVCPHHPEATLDAFRVDCDCRKPRPGLLRRAAAELHLELDASFMVGDRGSDVTAGALAGCTTVLVRSGRHLDPPIRSTLRLDEPPAPDATCDDLSDAADWILAA